MGNQRCEDARARHLVGAVIDYCGNPDRRSVGAVESIEAGTRPVAERAEALVCRHAHDEAQSPLLDPGIGVGLEHPEIRHHPVGHLLEGDIIEDVEESGQA
ncbi:hypothetical protein [Halochromatium sp.]